MDKEERKMRFINAMKAMTTAQEWLAPMVHERIHWSVVTDRSIDHTKAWITEAMYDLEKGE